MSGMQLEPTAIAQWHTLVRIARAECGADLDEPVEAYLVFMLMRFAERTGVGRQALALEFLQGLQDGPGGAERLRATGDECLLVCGLFPQRIRRRRVPFRYYVDLGRGAYGSLAQAGADNQAEPFAALAAEFITLMEVLQAMRAADAEQQLSAIEAAEITTQTGSQQAWDRVAPTDGTLVGGSRRNH